MRNLARLAVVLFALFAITANAKEYYVSTSGNDSNPGTLASPFKTLQKISSLALSPGDIVYIRAGTYKGGSTSNSPQYSWLINGKNGNSSNPITIAAYPADFASGGRVVFDCSDFSYTANHIGIYIQNSSYLLIKGIRVTGIPQKVAGQVCIGWWVNGNSGGNITLENCEADHIGNTGFRLDNTNNATFLNCDAHHIDNPYDAGVQKHGGSDGFGRYDPSNTSTNTIYKGCRAWFCSDDGWDCFGSPGTSTYDGCWAFWSGYVQDVFPLTHTQGGVSWGDGNGIKLGGDNTPKDYTNTKRVVKNCVAFENYNNGFDQNMANVKMEFYNNTAYKCAIGFSAYTQAPSPMIAKNNLAYSCTKEQSFVSSVTTQSNNTWNGIAATASSFASLSNTGVDGSRQSNGSLPNLQFLHLAAGSNLINAGISVLNLLFSGSAPDIGAFEYGGTTSIIANKSPVANAGSDQTISLPTSSLTLNGSGTDADGSISAYQWTKVSGPAQYSIASSTSATTVVSNLAQGSYQFELKVTDNSSAVGRDTVKVTVNATTGNALPVANAGTNKTITLPTNSITLDGSASSDADGSIASYKWVKLNGGAGTIANTTVAKTTASGLVAGQYTFELTVTDNKGATSKAQVVVTVNATATGNLPPVANAGANQTITLPTNWVILNGSASSDPDGSIASYKWVKLSSGAGTISNTTVAKPTINYLVAGQYTFELTVTDNKGATSKAQVVVTVNATTTTTITGNLSPVANAGTNQTITLPKNWVILNGSASSDPDGSIASYKWVKLSGGAGTISNTTVAKPTINYLVAGQYTFELTVTDNKGATSKAQTKVTVASGSRTITGIQDTAVSTQSAPAVRKSFGQFNLYPNPASDIINAEISNDSIGVVSLSIYDLNGRIVKKMELNRQLVGNNVSRQVQTRNVNGVPVNSTQAYFTLPVNISSLGRGVYIMETIIDKKTRISSRFIKY